MGERVAHAVDIIGELRGEPDADLPVRDVIEVRLEKG